MSWHRIFSASVLVLAAEAATAQVPSIGQTVCVYNCGGSRPAGNAPSRPQSAPRAPAALPPADQIFNQANAYSRAGRWDEAEQLYRQALALNPRHGPAHYGLAYVLAKQGDGEGALLEVRAALKAGLHGDIKRTAENWMAELKNWEVEEEAIARANAHPVAQPAANPQPAAAVAAGPSPAELRWQRHQQAAQQNDLGMACINKDDWACGARYFQAALALDPGDPVITKNLWMANDILRREAEAAQLDKQRAAAGADLLQSMHAIAAKMDSNVDFDGHGNAPASSTLDFMTSVPPEGVSTTAGAAKPGCGPVTDSSVVNLCDAITDVVDPNRVKGQTAAAAKPPLDFLREAPNSPPADTALPVQWPLSTVSAFAFSDQVEIDKAREVDDALQAEAEVQARIREAQQKGDQQTVISLLQQSMTLEQITKEKSQQLTSLAEVRIGAGMSILLQDPTYASAWKGIVARIRQEEVASFAKADAELQPLQQKRNDAWVQGNADEAQKLDNEFALRRRQAQVNVLKQSIDKLDAEAQSLMQLSTLAH